MYLPAHQDPRGGSNRNNVNQVFFKIWSPEMAYVLGYVIADGAIEDVQKSSRTCYLTISSSDLSILEKIRATLQSQHHIVKRPPQLHTFTNGKQYTSKLQYILRIGSKKVYNDLLILGVTPRKSLTISFPQIPIKYLSFFARGYFDGDGCIHLKAGKYPLVIFTSGSLRFLKDLSKILSQVLQISEGSIYTQIEKHKNPCYRLRYNPTLSKVLLSFMYKNLEMAPFLERKYQIYQRYLNLR